MTTIVGECHWTKEQIATLTSPQVARLNYDEMVEIVLTAGVPVRDVERIHSMDGETLVRLVNWARECCQREAICVPKA